MAEKEIYSAVETKKIQTDPNSVAENKSRRDSASSTEGEQENQEEIIKKLELLSNYQRDLTKTKEAIEKDTIGPIQERVTKMENRIEEIRINVINSLGVFIALFTFISVEFQLFQSLTSFTQYLSLTLILSGVFMFFVLFLDFVSQKNKHSKFTLPKDIKSHRWSLHQFLFGLCLILISLGILIGIIPKKQELNNIVNNGSSININKFSKK